MIRLSQNHGVNPSLGLCFFCGEAKEVVLLGAMGPKRRDEMFGPELSARARYNDVDLDAAAPREAVYNDEPCDKCAGYMKQGVLLISVRDGEKPGNPNPYRTGGWSVMSEDYIRRMFQGDAAEDLLKKRMGFVPDEVWTALGLPPRTEAEHKQREAKGAQRP